MLKSLGILAWGGCLLTLIYQGITWVLNGSWTSITLMSVLRRLFGLDLLSAATELPLDVTAKVVYVAATTELALFLWWLGAALFALMFVLGLLKR